MSGESRRRRVFDKAYYDRFYGDADTCVTDAEITGRLGAFVCSYLENLDVKVSRVLDIGCGTGLWRDVISEHFPEADYTGVEVSDYLCRAHGWRRGSVVDFRARGAFDLVICQGVLQYLNERDAREAIVNLDRLCKGALLLQLETEPRHFLVECLILLAHVTQPRIPGPEADEPVAGRRE